MYVLAFIGLLWCFSVLVVGLSLLGYWIVERSVSHRVSLPVAYLHATNAASVRRIHGGVTLPTVNVATVRSSRSTRLSSGIK